MVAPTDFYAQSPIKILFGGQPATQDVCFGACAWGKSLSSSSLQRVSLLLYEFQCFVFVTSVASPCDTPTQEKFSSCGFLHSISEKGDWGGHGHRSRLNLMPRPADPNECPVQTGPSGTAQNPVRLALNWSTGALRVLWRFVHHVNRPNGRTLGSPTVTPWTLSHPGLWASRGKIP